MSFFYDFFLAIGCLFQLPKLLKKNRTRHHLQIPIIPTGKKILWVHAISLGETKAAAELIKILREKHPHLYIITTSVTDTGFEEAEKNIYADHHMYLPLDFSRNMKKLMRAISPDLLLLIETDFWYHFLRYAKKEGAKIFLLSGKISKRSCKRFRWLSYLSRKLFSQIDIFCVQNTKYQKRFRAIGIEKEKIHVTGNLKLDEKPEWLSVEKRERWMHAFCIQSNDRVVTLASTHFPEEELLLFELLHEKNLKIFLAPRHPERFEEIAKMLYEKKIPYGRYSRMDFNGTERVLLIDTMGFLPICYQLSEFAIVGGSFTNRIGGHNILEPVYYHLPVFFGPHMHEQMELEKIVLKSKAGSKILISEVASILQKNHTLLKDASKELSQHLGGSVDATLKILQPFLEE